MNRVPTILCGVCLWLVADPMLTSGREIPGQGVATLAYSPNGTLCQLLLDNGEILFRERPGGGDFREERVLIDGRPLHGVQPMLLFDDQGRPNIVDGYSTPGGPGRGGWFRREGDRWIAVGADGAAAADATAGLIPLPRPLNRVRGQRTTWEGFVPEAMPLDRPAQFLWPSLAAAFAPDGTLRLLFCDEPEKGPLPAPPETPFHFHLGRQGADGGWHWQVVETFTREWNWENFYNPPRAFGFVVDGEGHHHILYVRGYADNYPARPRRKQSSLRYVSDRDGEWRSEVVSAPGDETADAGLGGSIAVDSQGEVHVASCYLERGPGCSPEFARLVLHRRQPDGQWIHEPVAKEADAYQVTVQPPGTPFKDPPKGTGFYPCLVLDRHDRPHILFCDFATQHWPIWHCMDYVGQLRHARFDGTHWHLQTLIRQADPLREQLRYPIMAISDDEIAYAAMAREAQIDDAGRNTSLRDRFVEGRLPLP